MQIITPYVKTLKRLSFSIEHFDISVSLQSSGKHQTTKIISRSQNLELLIRIINRESDKEYQGLFWDSKLPLQIQFMFGKLSNLFEYIQAYQNTNKVQISVQAHLLIYYQQDEKQEVIQLKTNLCRKDENIIQNDRNKSKSYHSIREEQEQQRKTKQSYIQHRLDRQSVRRRKTKIISKLLKKMDHQKSTLNIIQQNMSSLIKIIFNIQSKMDQLLIQNNNNNNNNNNNLSTETAHEDFMNIQISDKNEKYISEDQEIVTPYSIFEKQNIASIAKMYPILSEKQQISAMKHIWDQLSEFEKQTYILQSKQKYLHNNL